VMTNYQTKQRSVLAMNRLLKFLRWQVVLLLFLLSLFLASPVFAQPSKEDITTPEKPYNQGVTQNPHFQKPTDAKARYTIRLDMPSRDETVEISVCLEQFPDGGITWDLDKDGNIACGCGFTKKPGAWVDRDGNPTTSAGVTCTSRDNKRQSKICQRAMPIELALLPARPFRRQP
jgi:hypothetical protein